MVMRDENFYDNDNLMLMGVKVRTGKDWAQRKNICSPIGYKYGFSSVCDDHKTINLTWLSYNQASKCFSSEGLSGGGIVTLVALVAFSPLCVFKCWLKLLA